MCQPGYVHLRTHAKRLAGLWSPPELAQRTLCLETRNEGRSSVHPFRRWPLVRPVAEWGGGGWAAGSDCQTAFHRGEPVGRRRGRGDCPPGVELEGREFNTDLV